MPAPLPSDENERLALLKECGALDTPFESSFDELVCLAALICRVPIAAVSLVDRDRQWFKSAVGLPMRETPRDMSFCAHAILHSEVLIVEDATRDARFRDNPLVLGPPGIRFYAGAPLLVPDAAGAAIGTLCVIDTCPRELASEQRLALEALARQVVAQLQLRRNLDALRRTRERLALATDAAGIGVWEWDVPTDSLHWDEHMFRLYGRSPSAAREPYSLWTDGLHPLDRQRAEAQLREALRSGSKFDSEFRVLLPDGTVRHLRAAAQIWRDEDGGASRVVGVNVDITRQVELQAQLIYAARTDRLTGLPNREAFLERLRAAVARARAGQSGIFAVLLLDFDRFKLVNDTLGHRAGDELLCEVAARMRRTLRETDTTAAQPGLNIAARFGGDEFLILVSDLRSARDATAIADRLLRTIGATSTVGGAEIQCSASIGIVTSEQCLTSAEDIVRNADVAMYEAKRAGRGCWVLFDEPMHTRLARHLAIESALRRAIGTPEMHLVYQPIVELANGRLASAEALIRWDHPVLGSVSPAEFIPIAEESGLIVELGRWVQQEACEALARWRRERPADAPNTVSVNLSRAELALNGQLLSQIRALLARTGLPAPCLQLEITEREVMRNPEAALSLMQDLRAMGVRIAMDDFGTGTSSLAVLSNYPFDVIKIDRSFTHDLRMTPDVLAVMHATVTLVENLGMASCAEGVEDPVQLAVLQSLQCRYAQGYLFSRGVSADRLLDALAGSAVFARTERRSEPEPVSRVELPRQARKVI